MSSHTDRNIKVPQDKSVYLRHILKQQDLAAVFSSQTGSAD